MAVATLVALWFGFTAPSVSPVAATPAVAPAVPAAVAPDAGAAGRASVAPGPVVGRGAAR